MTEHLSKYAAKQRAKSEGKWVAPVSVAVSVSVSDPTPEEPEEMFVSLGALPQLCASHIEAARASLQKAASIAFEMERLAAPGIQRQEPKGIYGACHAMATRLKPLAKRASKIVNGGDE